MITQLHIKNFKSLKDVDLKLRNLNLLTGLNGSGKSSLIQVLLLLRQSQLELTHGRLLLSKKENELFDGGVAEDVYYQFGVDKHISFGLNLDNAEGLKWAFDCDIYKSPDANILISKTKYADADLAKTTLFNKAFQYLNAERLSPKSFYARNVEVVENEKSIGVFGEYAVHFLEEFGNNYKVEYPYLQHPKAKSEKLIHQVEAWLSEISPNVSIIPEKISNEETRITYQFGTNRGKTNRFKPKNVGFGLSYVLPVIVALLTAEKGKLLIIENPESHIHPRGQAELGKLIAGAAESGAQLFVETHSDHIVNGIRLAAKEKIIQPKNVVSFYFKRNDEDNSSAISSIMVDEKGKLHSETAEGTPTKILKGFFDEWTNSMAKLF